MRRAASLFSGQQISRSGIHTEDMDPTCKPCTDFWCYVNAGWLDKNPLKNWWTEDDRMDMPEFHRAFQCKTGDPMVRPVDRQCKLW